MSSPNLRSPAAPSPSRVRFNPDVSPATGRPRRASLPYPKVAQTKGSADRKFSFDLFWKLHTLSAVSNIIPVDSTDSANKVQANEPTSPKPAEPEVPTTPTRSSRPHNYILLSRKQTKALLDSEDPRDRRLKELVRGGREAASRT